MKRPSLFKWSLESIFKISTTNKHLDCLRYVCENGYQLNETLLIELATKNNFTALKFFNENFPDELNFSKYIIANNYKWGSSLTALIAYNGDLDALKIFRKYNCSWLVQKICYYASKRGHINCLRYAHENGCMLNNKCYKVALKYNHLDCAKYIKKNGGCLIKYIENNETCQNKIKDFILF